MKRQARGHHQALLRARETDINAPGIVLIGRSAQTGNRIHHEQRGMPHRINRAPDFPDLAENAR